MFAYRHGDLLLVATDKPGKGRKTRPVNGRLVILEGEATGHAHTVSPEHAELVPQQGVLALSLLANIEKDTA